MSGLPTIYIKESASIILIEGNQKLLQVNIIVITWCFMNLMTI